MLYGLFLPRRFHSVQWLDLRFTHQRLRKQRFSWRILDVPLVYVSRKPKKSMKGRCVAVCGFFYCEFLCSSMSRCLVFDVFSLSSRSPSCHQKKLKASLEAMVKASAMLSLHSRQSKELNIWSWIPLYMMPWLRKRSVLWVLGMWCYSFHLFGFLTVSFCLDNCVWSYWLLCHSDWFLVIITVCLSGSCRRCYLYRSK